MLPRSDIEAMDQPTILYVIYRVVNAHRQTFLCETAEYH